MTTLILGVLLFAGVHLIPSMAVGVKAALQAKVGENGYKGIFSILLLASFALMIIGWRSAVPTYVYTPVAQLHSIGLALIAGAFFLFVISNRPSKLKRIIRHPQLTGVALWAFAHLLINGDSRSAVLFGGLLLWAVFEIILINRRDGIWVKADSPGWSADLINIGVTAVVVIVLTMIHPWLAGVGVY